jgi:hypothetical protein
MGNQQTASASKACICGEEKHIWDQCPYKASKFTNFAFTDPEYNSYSGQLTTFFRTHPGNVSTSKTFRIGDYTLYFRRHFDEFQVFRLDEMLTTAVEKQAALRNIFLHDSTFFNLS